MELTFRPIYYFNMTEDRINDYLCGLGLNRA